LDLLANRVPGRLIVDSCPWFKMGGVVTFTSGPSAGMPLLYLSALELIYSILYRELRRGYGAVVVLGKKGVGKSAAAAYALCRLVGSKVSVGAREYTVVGIDIDTANLGGLRGAVEELNRLGYIPVLYFDPSPIGAYRGGGRYVPRMPLAEARAALDELKWYTSFGKAVLLAVASDDQYDELKLGSAVGAEVRVDVPVGSNTFSELIRSICKCDDHGLGEKLAKQFRGEYYWVAALAAADALELGASPEDALREAEGAVYGYAANYIWRHILGGDSLLASYAAPVVLAAGLGLDVDSALAFVRKIGGPADSLAIKWFAKPHTGVLGSVIEMAAKSAVYRATGLGSDELCQRTASCELIHPIVGALKNIRGQIAQA